MSTHVAAWAWRQKLGDPGLKLVLVKLADNADEQGCSWWGQKRLAEECEMSRATVQRKLAILAERGFLEVEERRRENGGRTSNGYRIVRPQSEAGGVPVQTRLGDALPGEAASEPSSEPKDSSSSSSKGQKSRPPRIEVQGKQVTAEEYEMAQAVLAAFNEVAGTKFSGTESIKKIVRRLREHTDVSLERHREIIRQQFERPWWKGDPSPSVIYGNGDVFDRALNEVRGPESGKVRRYATE